MDVDEVDGGCFGKPQKIYLKSDENYYKDDEDLRYIVGQVGQYRLY